MTPKRIIFVDDDPDLLQGVRDALRRRRKVWEMVFVTSGQAALQAMAAQPFDLIVTDMRMPGMDGAELLARVCATDPGMSRIVLTGHAETEQLNRASSLAHQILSKPCDGATLQATIEVLLQARDQARNERVRSLVGQVTSLPSVQWVHSALVAAAKSPTCRVDEFAAILENDPGLTARVLQLANSACFGDHERLHSVLGAIRYLGFNQVSALVLLAQTFQTVERLAGQGSFDVAAWQAHSLLCAGLARRLCADPDRIDDAYVAGLLHDIGCLVFVLGCAGPYAEVQRLMATERAAQRDAELRVIGVTHHEVGSYLLACWGFEAAVIAAVGHQLLPLGQDAVDGATTAAAFGTDAVVQATWMAHDIAMDAEALCADPEAVQIRLQQWQGLRALDVHGHADLLNLLARHSQSPRGAAASAAPVHRPQPNAAHHHVSAAT